MPRVNRSEIVATDEVQAFHLVNRCVRKSFLCGKDLQTGRDFSHRKNWIRDRLEELAGIFAIEILSYSVMDNHVHVVVKTRPDLVRSWSDGQTALRWWNLFPQRRHQDGTPAVPTEQELHAIQIDRSRLIQLRKRLSCVSWFMRCLAEPIARRANREEETTGRFWDGRFFAQPLLDEAAIAACIAYVELNALRARTAHTLEESEFNSARDRIDDRKAASAIRGSQQKRKAVEGSRAGWLSPIELRHDLKKSELSGSKRRASNQGCLPMSQDQYLTLLDWTGRQTHRGKPGATPVDAPPILERLGMDPNHWLAIVRDFRKVFRFEAGRPESRLVFRQQRKQRRSAASTV